LPVNLQWYWAEYTTFIVDAESTNYMLHVAGYNGTAGDAMRLDSDDDLNGATFTTKDRDNDNFSSYNCANDPWATGGFWANNCFSANVNNADNTINGFSWWTLPTGGSTDKVTRGLRSSKMTLIFI